MERKVIFRDRQEFQAADANNIEDFTDASLQSILINAISTENKIAGMNVIAKSATEISVSPGKLLVGATGKMYSLDDAMDISLFSYLPVMDKKYVAICGVGSEEEIDIQARDFVVDVAQEITEPREVAMENKRAITLYIVAGVESADPQRPTIPTGYTVRAYILLTGAGIDTIEMNTLVDLPNLNRTSSDVKNLKEWQTQTEPVLSTLSTDVSAIASKLSSIKDHNQAVREIASDVARLKEIGNLPDSFSSYGADYFLDNDESDVQHENYDAQVDEGVRFPSASTGSANLSLFNQYEPQVFKGETNGFIIPIFEHNKRIGLTGYAGDISISQYQSQSFNFDKGKMGREREKYGPLRVLSSNVLQWRTGKYDHLKQRLLLSGEEATYVPSDDEISLFNRKLGMFVDRIIPSYFYNIPSTTTINGSQIAQTFLSAQHGYLTKIGLFFTKRDTNGLVNIHICEVKDGVPDITKCLAELSLAPSLLNLYPVETSVSLPKPIYLTAGKRYALVITTTGDHRLAIVSGSSYLQGTLFYNSDGTYYSGDLTKDIMLNLYFAKFSSSFAQVNLNPISLTGGIADIDLLASIIRPESTELFIQYQLNGQWYPLNPDTALNLNGFPSLLPLRAVFVGSEDVMPAMELSNSVIVYSRPKVAFKHYSTTRTLGSARTDIQVQVLLENFDETPHGCVVTLLVNGTETSADNVSDEVISDGIVRRTASFTFDPGISAYQIIIEGSTTDASNCFVISERIDVAL